MRLTLLFSLIILFSFDNVNAQRSNRFKDDIKIGYGRFIIDNNDTFNSYIYGEYSKVFYGRTSIGLEASYTSGTLASFTPNNINKSRSANLNIILYYSIWQSINAEHDLRLGIGLSGRFIASDVDFMVMGVFTEDTETSFNPGLSPMANYDYTIADQFIIGGKIGLQFLEKSDTFIFAGLHVGLKFK